MGWELEQLRDRRDELLARGLPSPTIEELVTINLPDDADDAQRAALEEWRQKEGRKIDTYLTAYVLGLVRKDGEEVVGAGGCPCCLSRLGGLLGAFQWGLVHGHGSCAECDWPVTGYHYLYLDDRGDRRGRLKPDLSRGDVGEADLFLPTLLPAHPSGVILRDEVRVFELEVEYPRDPDDRRSLRATYTDEDEAAQQYESEGGSQPWEEVVDELRELGQVEDVNDEIHRTVTLTRTIQKTREEATK